MSASPAAAAVLPPAWRVWVSTLRLRTLPAALVPVLVGSSLAAAWGQMVPWRAGLALLAALLIQIGTNLYNDYGDFVRGADTAARLGPARASQRGWLTAQQVKSAAQGAFAAAALAGLPLVWVGGWPLLGLGTASIALGFGYTGGPYPLAYHGLGELFVLLFFGLVAVGGTFYLHTLQAPPLPVLGAGLAIGLLASAILVVNNLRDRHTDAAVGKRTLAVRLGDRRSRWQYALMLAAAYLAGGLGAQSQGAGWLLTGLSLPLAGRCIWEIFCLRGAALNGLLGRTAQLELAYGLLLALGIHL